MAFKTLKDYNEERYGGWFLLRNDGDYADVVFLYPSTDDVLIADTHYIKSPEYSGYVHCCGRGCPACAKNVKVQTKLFIPMYNFTDNEIQFWDRSGRMENQLMTDVFEKYPNPSEIVFRITRHGEAGSVDTRYEIAGVARNSAMPFARILADNHISFPDAYSKICREYSANELYTLLHTSVDAPQSVGDMPDYQVTPRGGNVPAAASLPDIPETPDFEDSGLPEYTPGVAVPTPSAEMPSGISDNIPGSSPIIDDNETIDEDFADDVEIDPDVKF
jgi:hypothetical protein|nr:MAG TPA: hypothetical protein [Bacteriophage sp.]